MGDLSPWGQRNLKTLIDKAAECTWSPTDGDYSSIESFGYYGLDSTKSMSSLLGVPHVQFLYRSLTDTEIHRRYELGKSKCHLDIGKTITQAALGDLQCTSQQIQALSLVCKSRFEYNDEIHRTRLIEKKIHLDHKVKLRSLESQSKRHEDNMEFKTTVLAMGMTPSDVEFLKTESP